MSDYVCTACARRQADKQRCGACGADDQLLATDRREVRQLVRDMDDRRRDDHEARLRWASVLVAMVLGAAVVVYARPLLVLFPPLPFPFFLRVMLFMGVMGALIWGAAMKLWPSRRRFAWAQVDADEPEPGQPAT